MVYEIECEGSAVDLHVSHGGAPDDPTDWLIEARSNHSADAVVISERGPTRADALRGVSRAWSEQALFLGLPHFDWDAVTRVLVAVRAI
jgi:hypothetical protein